MQTGSEGSSPSERLQLLQLKDWFIFRQTAPILHINNQSNAHVQEIFRATKFRQILKRVVTFITLSKRSHNSYE